ncbi:MAG TPA: C45 family peptidase [Planctomycetota bacterium]|nr:C45 family peptidase [Planctomycetota bacterium]
MNRRTLLALALLLLPLAPRAHAQSILDEPRKFVERLRKESRIERKMALGEIRGVLGFYKRPAPPDWSERTWKKGKLEVVHGVPVLRLEGTPEEMAEQHAHLLKKECRVLVDHYLPEFLGKRELERGRDEARRLFWPHLSDSEKKEIQVFARESGIDEKDVLLSQCFPDLYRAWGCSTLAAVGSGTAEGPLLARNLDFLTMGYLQDFSVVVVAKPEGKKPYVSVTWPGLLGVLSAQNDSVALAVMVVHDEHGCDEGVPFQLAFRRAIEEASTAEDVQRTLERLPLTVTNNLMVVDHDGGARLLEITPEKIVARKPDAGGHITSTNHFQSDALKERRVTLTYRSSVQRLAALTKVCGKQEKTTIPLACEALRAAAAGKINVQSMVFLPGAGEILVAFGKTPAADHAFVKLSRDELLGH